MSRIRAWGVARAVGLAGLLTLSFIATPVVASAKPAPLRVTITRPIGGELIVENVAGRDLGVFGPLPRGSAYVVGSLDVVALATDGRSRLRRCTIELIETENYFPPGSVDPVVTMKPGRHRCDMRLRMSGQGEATILVRAVNAAGRIVEARLGVFQVAPIP